MRAYRVAYDGSDYRGFQRQPDVPTVEDALLDALRALGVREGNWTPGNARAVPPGWSAAGRTDAGVSARAQTVALDAPAWLSPAAFNAELPADVRVWASADAPPGFHATHDARERTYTYALYAPETATPGVAAVADERVRAATERLTGTHDFRNLTPDERGTERRLRVCLERDGPMLCLRFRAGGFPRQLVRRAVALVAAVGRGERERASVGRLLGPTPPQGSVSVGPAPPEPLVLSEVAYPLFFERDEEAVASLRAVFGTRRAEHRSRAAVADHIADR